MLRQQELCPLLFGLVLFASTLSVSFSANADVAELDDPDWREVPGSYSSTHDGSAFVDANIVRIGELATYDVLDADLNYSRIEANCRTFEYRLLRQGYLESTTRVNYLSMQRPWSNSGPYQRNIIEFVCSL